MGSKKLLTAILALLMTASVVASVASLSTTAVAESSHTSSGTISPTRVRNNVEIIFTLTVSNAGPDAIDNVMLNIIPTGFTGIASTAKIPAGDNVFLTPGNENRVVLKAGTLVRLDENTTITIYDGTTILRGEGENLYVENNAGTFAENVQVKPGENVALKLLQDVTTGDNLLINDNVRTVSERAVTLTDNVVAMVLETMVVRVTDNVVRLPEDADVKILSDVAVNADDNGLLSGDNVVTQTTRTVTVDNGRAVLPQSTVFYLSGTTTEVTIGAGSFVRLGLGENLAAHDNRAILPAGTTVGLAENVLVTIYEDTVAYRAAAENLTAPTAVTQPEGWSFNTADNSWTGIADNVIAAGGTLAIPFAITTPTTEGSYEIAVRTDDTENETWDFGVSVFVDATRPTLEVKAEPSVTNSTVTIIVKSDEPLARLDNVYVIQNPTVGMAWDNYERTVSMTPDAENKVWTGTYTIIDNWYFDNDAYVWVENAGYEDLVGLTGTDENEQVFRADQLPPPALASPDIVTFPENTRQKSWSWSGVARDNIGGALGTADNSRIVVLLDNDVKVDKPVGVGAVYIVTLALEEGPNEVRVRVIDNAGNVGEDNVQNVFLDTIDPTVTVETLVGVTFEENMYINDNTPTFVAKILDPGYPDTGLGVLRDNIDIDLIRDDGSVAVPDLENAAAWDPTTGIFENTLPELTDNAYRIRIQASDVISPVVEENFRFILDTRPPGAPSAPAPATPPAKIGIGEETISFTCSVEAYGTLKVYAGPTGTDLIAEAEDTDGDNSVSVSVTFTKDFEGLNLLKLTTTDRAGNEGPAYDYGTVDVDLTAPVVEILEPVTRYSTTETSVLVRGTVDDPAVATVTIVATAGTLTDIPVADFNAGISVPLAEGWNSISVRATDGFGNTGSDSVLVERTVTPWATYAAVIAIIAVILAAIAVLRRK
jgi:uncharacterized repeat protein (TIGR01451 family)